MGSIVGELIAQNNLSIKFKIHGLKTGFIDSDIPSNLEKKYQMDIKSLKKINRLRKIVIKLAYRQFFVISLPKDHHLTYQNQNVN